MPDGSYSVSDTQDYFENVIKNHEVYTDNPQIRTCVNQIGNRIAFKIKTGYCLQILTSETTKLLGSTKIK